MGNNNDDETKKVIQMDRSRTERAFDEKESLWDSHEINRMLKLIEKHVGALVSLKKQGINEKEWPLLSIGIFGSPGSGKTSLLRTFVSRARGRTPKYSHIHSLPVIKPNTIAKDDHFLYAFLATALKEDREANEKKGPQYGDSPVLTPLQQKFQEVSEYLQVINEAERSQEDDPLGRSLERLERHESGLLLIEKMDGFIKELVGMMAGNKDAPAVVLLPVDDVDMSMDILVSALDTCWRYLKHPQLVPLFTFTGRLAEELLRVHYERKLTLEGRSDSPGKLWEAATSLMLTENMAIQYLGRLFPVRNRIRMGQAAARVLRAKYTSSRYNKSDSENEQDHNHKENNGKEKKNNGEVEVIKLLKTVSILLFGHSGQFVPEIRAPLRMVTLRRQLQIVDAMQEAGIDKLNIKNIKPGSEYKDSWAYLFDLATWTLLNTHRDIMREINLNLDDLYGWTPQGLRIVVGDSILSLPLKKRRKLLTKWRYRTEGRRTQMLSLLAANVFRPWMDGIEPTGDDIDKFELWKRKDKYLLSFPVRDGIIWFLDLCIGFYLPQVLACNFPDEPGKKGEASKWAEKGTEGKEETSAEFITGIGWDFVNGPLHAIREALYNEDRFFSGMLFIDSVIMEGIIKDLNDSKKSQNQEEPENYSLFLAYLFCFYGYDGGVSWAAVSFWRGLGLIGQLLKLTFPGQRVRDSHTNTFKPYEKKDRKNDIEVILKNHIKSSKVIGHPPKRFSEVVKSEEVIFEVFDNNEYFVKRLVSNIESWLDTQKGNMGLKERINPMKEGNNWETCFIRRLHGKSIISEFWRDLGNVYFEIQPLYKKGGASNATESGSNSNEEEEQKDSVEMTVDVKAVIKGWIRALIYYWNGGTSNGKDDSSLVQGVFKRCPIFQPFIDRTWKKSR